VKTPSGWLDDVSGIGRKLLERLADVSHENVDTFFGLRDASRPTPRAHFPRGRVDGNELALRQSSQCRSQRVLITLGKHCDIERLKSECRHVDVGCWATKLTSYEACNDDPESEQSCVEREEFRAAEIEDVHASPQ